MMLTKKNQKRFKKKGFIYTLDALMSVVFVMLFMIMLLSSVKEIKTTPYYKFQQIDKMQSSLSVLELNDGLSDYIITNNATEFSREFDQMLDSEDCWYVDFYNQGGALLSSVNNSCFAPTKWAATSRSFISNDTIYYLEGKIW